MMPSRQERARKAQETQTDTTRQKLEEQFGPAENDPNWRSGGVGPGQRRRATAAENARREAARDLFYANSDGRLGDLAMTARAEQRARGGYPGDFQLAPQARTDAERRAQAERELALDFAAAEFGVGGPASLIRGVNIEDLLQNLGGPTSGGGGRAGGGQRSAIDEERALLERNLARDLEGVQSMRDLQELMASTREEQIGSAQTAAEQKASESEQFLETATDQRRAEEARQAEERASRQAAELSRQQVQRDEALEAAGVDTAAASDVLRQLGIDPGDALRAEQNDTTAMLYSQQMSAANMVSNLGEVATQMANFATNANDMAASNAAFGITQDLAAAIQAFDQARLQGQIDDAQALQAIEAAERQAQQQFDIANTALTLKAREQAAAAAAAAARQRRSQLQQQQQLADSQNVAIAFDAVRNGIPLSRLGPEILESIARSDSVEDLFGQQDVYNERADTERQRIQDMEFQLGRDEIAAQNQRARDEQLYLYDLGKQENTFQNQIARDQFLNSLNPQAGAPVFINQLGQPVELSASLIPLIQQLGGLDQIAPFITPQVR